MKTLSVLLLTACAALAQAPAAPAKPPAGTAAAAPALEPGLYAILRTSLGTITAQLFEKETPITVRNFSALARGVKAWKDPKTGAMVKRPLYNNLIFHRVIPNFMIQTGDPTGSGSGECGFTIPDEIRPTLKFDRPGRLGMANIGSKNTGGCQFFITEVAYPSLDGSYTLFGQVVEGQDVVNKIAHVPTGANDKPRTAVRLISVTMKREGPPPAPAVRKAAPKKAATGTKKAPATKK